MLSKSQIKLAREKTLQLLEDARISLTQDEMNTIEIADFGLNRFGLDRVTAYYICE